MPGVSYWLKQHITWVDALRLKVLFGVPCLLSRGVFSCFVYFNSMQEVCAVSAKNLIRISSFYFGVLLMICVIFETPTGKPLWRLSSRSWSGWKKQRKRSSPNISTPVYSRKTAATISTISFICFLFSYDMVMILPLSGWLIMFPSLTLYGYFLYKCGFYQCFVYAIFFSNVS